MPGPDFDTIVSDYPALNPLTLKILHVCWSRNARWKGNKRPSDMKDELHRLSGAIERVWIAVKALSPGAHARLADETATLPRLGSRKKMAAISDGLADLEQAADAAADAISSADERPAGTPRQVSPDAVKIADYILERLKLPRPKRTSARTSTNMPSAEMVLRVLSDLGVAQVEEIDAAGLAQALWRPAKPRRQTSNDANPS